MMRDSKTITMEQCDLPTKFTAMDPTPDYLTDLLYQHGAFKSSVIKKEWLVALLQQMKRIAGLREHFVKPRLLETAATLAVTPHPWKRCCPVQAAERST